MSAVTIHTLAMQMQIVLTRRGISIVFVGVGTVVTGPSAQVSQTVASQRKNVVEGKTSI